MCFEAATKLRLEIKYAMHRSEDPERIAQMEEELKRLTGKYEKHYFVSAFDHPTLLVFTDAQPFRPQAFEWGLIPGWVRDRQAALEIRTKTLNARSETIFEKPSFKAAAKGKRCLIMVDGFYEYHHYKSKTYPYFIQSVQDEPLTLAGLWEEWVDKETGEVVQTCTVVTTEANGIMARIHNNPKLDGPRMPVILSRENQEEWLKPCCSDEDAKAILSLCRPCPENILRYHTVRRHKGKNGVGDVPEALDEFLYQELL